PPDAAQRHTADGARSLVHLRRAQRGRRRALPVRRGGGACRDGTGRSMKIAVLEKCFTLLESMADLDRPSSLKDLAAATQLPKATLHRLLQTLLELGYVEQDRSRSNYQITMQLAQLGRSHSFQGLKERALPRMEAIHQRFDETVNLGVLQGAHVY